MNQFAREHTKLAVRLLRTPSNLGYDANLRFLIDHAEGRYCVFMGDDDLWCAGALNQLRKAIDGLPEVGVILRAWQTVSKATGELLDVHRYFPDDRVFKPGPGTVAAFFRRSIFLSGLTICTDAARRIETDKFDGTLLYQPVPGWQLTYDDAGILCIANDRYSPSRRGTLLWVERKRERAVRPAPAFGGTFAELCPRSS